MIFIYTRDFKECVSTVHPGSIWKEKECNNDKETEAVWWQLKNDGVQT